MTFINHLIQQCKKQKLPLVALAPMVNHSERAYRILTQRYGISLTYSPMIHASNFSRSERFRHQNFEHSDCYEDGNLIVQFCGHDPDIILNAAKYVEHNRNIIAIDLNFGCPQKIASKGNYGAYLLENENNIMEKIVNKLSTNLSVPITCKMRLPIEKSKGIDIAKKLENAGASLLCIHGRNRLENKNNCGEADWNQIKNIKQNVHIPVLANGSISNMDDIHECIKYTNVDGVAIGEALLEFPQLVNNKMNDYAGQIEIAYEYLDLVELYYTNHWRLHLYKILHSHFSKLNQMFSNNKGNRLRGKLSKCKTTEDGKNILNELTDLMNNYGYHDAVVEKEMMYYYRYRKHIFVQHTYNNSVNV